MGYHLETEQIPHVWYTTAESVNSIDKLGEYNERYEITNRQKDSDILEIIEECKNYYQRNKIFTIRVVGENCIYRGRMAELIRALGDRGLYNIKFEDERSYRPDRAGNALFLLNRNPGFIELSTGNIIKDPSNDSLILNYIRTVKPKGINEVSYNGKNITALYNNRIVNLLLYMNGWYNRNNLKDYEHINLQKSEEIAYIYTFPVNENKPQRDYSGSENDIVLNLRGLMKAYFNGCQYQVIKNRNNLPDLKNRLNKNYIYMEPVKQSDYFRRSCIAAYDLKRYINKYNTERFLYANYDRMLFYDEIDILDTRLFVMDVEFVTYISRNEFRLYKSPTQYRDVSYGDLEQDIGMLYVPRIVAIDYTRIENVGGEISIDFPLLEEYKRNKAAQEQRMLEQQQQQEIPVRFMINQNNGFNLNRVAAPVQTQQSRYIA